jgi:hypothetical protein
VGCTIVTTERPDPDNLFTHPYIYVHARVPAGENLRAPQINAWSSSDSSRCSERRIATFSARMEFWRGTGAN